MPASLTPGHRATLLCIARASVRHGQRTGRALVPDLATLPAPMHALRASFVTLHLHGRLRGCIGALQASMPLAADVAEHAFAAAYRDPRFTPVQGDEIEGLDYHISVLSPAEPLRFADEAELLARLRPAVDGLIIERDERRATFLPAVWQTLPDPACFLAHLKDKAGIARQLQDYRAWIYTTESFAG